MQYIADLVVILRSPVSFAGRRKNLIFFDSTVPQIIKDDSRDCHDLKKRGLAMTDWVEEILTRESTAQDDTSGVR